MHAYKILLTAISGILLVASCGNSSRKVESLITQRDQARAQLKLTQDNYIQQNKELTAIMEELNVLSGKTLSLQLNIEGEHNPMSQAELIDESIKVLKNKLDELEHANSSITALNGVIGSLRTMVEKQETEISSLKLQIQQYEEDISQMNEDIIRKQSKIDSQQQEISDKDKLFLSSTEKRLQQLYNAGYELEKLADDDENILNLKGKRNKLSGMSYKASIYEKSLLFYQMAAKEGHQPSQSRYSIVRNKIAQMK